MTKRPRTLVDNPRPEAQPYVTYNFGVMVNQRHPRTGTSVSTLFTNPRFTSSSENYQPYTRLLVYRE